MEKQSISWQPIIELSIVLFTILGTTIPLYLHTDGKIHAMYANMEENRKETNQILQGIQIEMRDFHGRMCAIEERKSK